jgi:hypothetical protein
MAMVGTRFKFFMGGIIIFFIMFLIFKVTPLKELGESIYCEV